MTGFDRSAEFARRETATYNEPPETPADGMWTAVEERLAGIEAASSSRFSRVAEAGAPAGVGAADGLPFEALGRKSAASAPREEMRDANLAAQTVTHHEEQMFLQARRALNREQFDQAAEMFRAFRAKYNAGRFVADSYYWEAFARYRQEALTALLRLERGRMESIRSVLERKDECSVHLRHQAVNWLAREGTEEAEATLADVAANHPAAETRKWAVKGLAGFETPGSAEVLASILRNSEDESIRSDTIAALGYNRSEEATEAVAAFPSDIGEPEQLRQKAAAALGLRISAEPRLLMEVFDKVDSERIRISFLEVLGRRAQAGEESVAS